MALLAQATALPDLLAVLVALGVVVLVGRLLVRIVWKIVVVAAFVAGALWLVGGLDALGALPV